MSVSFQKFLEEHQIIEGILQSLGRSINSYNIKAYKGAIAEYKKRVLSGETMSHGTLIHKISTMYNIDPRSLDEILSRMIKANQIKKVLTPDSDSQMTSD